MTRLGLDVPDLREELRDGRLRLLQRRRRVLAHVRLVPHYPPEENMYTLRSRMEKDPHRYARWTNFTAVF